MSAIFIRNADDAKMLLDIFVPMNSVIIDQLALSLVSLDNMLQILSKSLLRFAKIGKIVYSTIAKIWLVKFVLGTACFLGQFGINSSS